MPIGPFLRSFGKRRRSRGPLKACTASRSLRKRKKPALPRYRTWSARPAPVTPNSLWSGLKPVGEQRLRRLMGIPILPGPGKGGTRGPKSVLQHDTRRLLILLFRIPAFRNAYLIRGLIVWGGLRLALAWGSVTNPNAALEMLVLATVGLAVLLDARRRS